MENKKERLLDTFVVDSRLFSKITIGFYCSFICYFNHSNTPFLIIYLQRKSAIAINNVVGKYCQYWIGFSNPQINLFELIIDKLLKNFKENFVICWLFYFLLYMRNDFRKAIKCGIICQSFFDMDSSVRITQS